MSSETETLRTDPEALLAELRAAGGRVKNRQAIHCPFHEDQHPSAGVYADEKAVWRFKCHAAGCGFHGDLYDVRAKAQGRPVEDVLKEASGRTAPMSPPSRIWTVEDFEGTFGERHEATYSYTDPNTKAVDLLVFRARGRDGRKKFWQARPVPGGIVLEAPPDPKPVYNRTRVRLADTVVVVEGEGCVHALADIGIVATTAPGGAGKAAHADWSPLAGKRAYLWPDNDPPDKKGVWGGIEHMRQVGAILETLDPPARLLWIDPDKLGLPPKGDVVDFLDPLGNITAQEKREAVEAVLQDAVPMGAAAEVGELVEDTISGERRAIVWPWDKVGRLTKALLPGTVTVLCGDAGTTKSLFLLEAAAYWHRQQIKLALFELEEGREYHAHRALAQAAGNAGLLDDEWVVQHPTEAREACAAHADFLDSFGRCIRAAPDEQVSLPQLAEWVERQAARGCEIIAIDPVTAAEATEQPWVADLAFLMRVKTAVKATGARLILVTHPKKGRKTAVGLDELAGGAAYARLTQTVLWIEVHRPPKQRLVKTSLGDTEYDVNRVLRLTKTRNGKGAGLRLAFDFDNETLRFRELGVIQREK